MSLRSRREERIAAQAKERREEPARSLLRSAKRCLVAIETYHTRSNMVRRGNLRFRVTRCTSQSGSHWNTIRLEPAKQPTKIVCVAPKDDVPSDLRDWVISELKEEGFKVKKPKDHGCCILFEVSPRKLPE